MEYRIRIFKNRSNTGDIKRFSSDGATWDLLSLEETFFTNSTTWSFHLRLLLIIRPRLLARSTVSRGLSFTIRGVRTGEIFAKLILISLHLDSFTAGLCRKSTNRVMNGQGFSLRPEAGPIILTYFLREFEWTPGNSVSESSILNISWELGAGGRGGGGREACPQTTLGSSRLRHSQGALRHQKMSLPVLSEICPLL